MMKPEMESIFVFLLGLMAGAGLCVLTQVLYARRALIAARAQDVIRWCRLKIQEIRQGRQRPVEYYSPEHLDSGDKIQFLLAKLAWVRRNLREATQSELRPVPSEDSSPKWDGDFMIRFCADLTEVHVFGAQIMNGYVLEIATNDPRQMQARYLEDLGTMAQSKLSTIYRAELSLEEFKSVSTQLEELWKEAGAVPEPNS